jgi:hypothetical protein
MEPAPILDAGEMAVNEVKVRHDLEQIEDLLDEGRLPDAWRKVADEYRALLQEVRGVTGGGIVVPFNVHRYPLVARTWKRPFHVAESGPRKSVLNPKLDVRTIEAAYLKSEPNLVVVDDLLDAATLDDLRRFCRESAVWNNIQSGYLGAYFFDGFACCCASPGNCASASRRSSPACRCRCCGDTSTTTSCRASACMRTPPR